MANPPYVSGSFQFPGQPALTPSPMEDAFRVLAAYTGGVAKKQIQEKEDFMDVLKAGIQAGFVEPDLSGGVSGGVKYRVVPKDERPEYIKALAYSKAVDTEAAAAAAQTAAFAPSSGRSGFGESLKRFTSALFGGAQTNTQSTLSGLAEQIKRNPLHVQELKASYKNPEYRSRLKTLLVRKYGLRADSADSAIDALVAQVDDGG